MSCRSGRPAEISAFWKIIRSTIKMISGTEKDGVRGAEARPAAGHRATANEAVCLGM